MGVAWLAASVSPATAQTNLLTNGDFEAGTTGWMVVGDLAMSVDTSVGGVEGPSALHVEAGTTGGVYRLQSQYWLSAVTPGAVYSVDAWVRDNDPGVAVLMRVDFVDGGGSAPEPGEPTPVLAGDSPDFRRLTQEVTAPAGSVYARVVFLGSFDGPGATFAVDGVVLEQVGAAPTVEPTQQPPPPPTPVVPTATPTPTATPKATTTPKPTATPKPPLLIGPFLRVAHDGNLAAPWEVTRGALEHDPNRGGLIFRVEGESTAWIEQAITVIPGGWYEASARLAPVDGVRAAWVRLAWYASADASGAQIETDDSGSVVGDGTLAIVVAGGLVTTGPVRAPLGAYSAKVRILLQPTSAAGAAILIEGIAFAGTSAPTPTPTPTPSVTPTPAPTAPTAPNAPITTPAPVGALDEPTATPTPPSGTTPASPVAVSPVVPAEMLAAQGALRITELMPDPLQPGRDADYEWVELTNLGQVVVALDGMTIRDAQASTALPAAVVPPGASIVVAGRLAEVDADVRLDGSIGNGLGNDGDRIELVDASGRVVDVVEYGAGTTLSVDPGDTVHRWFDGVGGFAGAGTGAPSPGVHAPLVTVADAPANVASGVATTEGGQVEVADDGGRAASGGTDVPAWVFLLAVGGGAVGGMAVQRFSQRRNPPAAL